MEARARPAVDASGAAAGGAGASGPPRRVAGPIPSCPDAVCMSRGAECPSIGDGECGTRCGEAERGSVKVL